MKIEPVKNYHKPEIPEIKQISKEFKQNFIPKRWLKNAIVAGAFYSFISFGCADKQTEQILDEPEKSEQTVQTKPAEQEIEPKEEIKFYRVAPIFHYGTGFDSFAMYTPMMMTHGTISEEEARQIIVDEMKKNGLEFITDGDKPSFTGVKSVNDERGRYAITPDAENPDAQPTKLFVFDGVNKDKKIAFEVVTIADVNPIQVDAISTTDLKNAAINLREEILTKQGDYTVGIFYDPVKDEKGGSGSFMVNDTLLRAQVQEFIKWLRDNNLLN